MDSWPSSPIGEVFRARLRQFPSLVNCCTIDWFNEWPSEALESVATIFLNEIPELEAASEVIEGLVSALVRNNQGELFRFGFGVIKAWIRVPGPPLMVSQLYLSKPQFLHHYNESATKSSQRCRRLNTQL